MIYVDCIYLVTVWFSVYLYIIAFDRKRQLQQTNHITSSIEVYIKGNIN